MDITLLVMTNVITALVSIMLGWWLATVALSLEFVRTQVKETIVDDTDPTPKRRRRFNIRDVILSILMIGFIVSVVSTVVVDRRADGRAQEIVDCVLDYANANADALDRRSTDNAALSDADAARDEALLQFIENPTDPALLEALEQTTLDKQAARAALEQGRQEQGYPEPPREVC